MERRNEGNSDRQSRVSETHFTGQPRYWKNNHGKSNWDNDKLNKCWNCDKPNCSMNNCKLPRNEKKIRINRIKHFEAKNNFNLDRKTKETLFQFSADYIEEVNNYDQYESDSDTNEDEENISVDDENIGEIQHILTKNQNNYLASIEDLMGF